MNEELDKLKKRNEFLRGKIEGIYVSAYWQDGLFVVGKGILYITAVSDIQAEIAYNNQQIEKLEGGTNGAKK